ncbi:MAG: N-acetylmuramoyl-L-alanine amidase [Acidimicrobiales bacterium]
MQGTYAGTDSWFKNPTSEVSAHLGHAKDGSRCQWVDTAQVTYAQKLYNPVSWSVEHEGQPGDSLTGEQCESLAQAIVQWHLATRRPIQRTRDPNGVGVIGHGELGIDGGAHFACPGPPILQQLDTVISRAQAIVSGDEEDDMKPEDVVDVLQSPQGGYWLLQANGEVQTKGQAKDLGSYARLPAQQRQGQRVFSSITPNPGGGYTLWSRAGERYDFQG